jgi:SAM-dependent methyltransferase/uncharacterized protein YbaR (Trm112 family)
LLEPLLPLLRCPSSGCELHLIAPGLLESSRGQKYRVIDGIPVLLPNAPSTLWVADASRQHRAADNYRIDTLGGLNELDRAILSKKLIEHASNPSSVDPVISSLIIATCGNMYASMKHQLPQVPIPAIRIPRSQGELLLDVGCSWGRWSIAAARKGYRVVGVDASLGAVLAAKRLAQREGVDACFVVADARYLPFESRSFTAAFSYSVLQHFSEEDARRAIFEANRVLDRGGYFKCQMASAFGVRSIWHMARRMFREPCGFEVRYYRPKQLRRMFLAAFNTVEVEVDGYFGLGIQPSDYELLPPFQRRVVRCSEFLRSVSSRAPALRYVADSLYLVGRRT